MRDTRIPLAIGAAYAGTIVSATWAVDTFGPVPVGFGLMAPAGVYFAGLAFTLRDVLHETAGPRWTMVAILAGSALSAAISGSLALAACVAFLLSETADMIGYTLARRLGWLRAIAVSNLVGLMVDSLAFLLIAFGSLAFLPGQILGKLWMTGAAVLVLVFIRERRRRAQRAAEMRLFGADFHATPSTNYLD